MLFAAVVLCVSRPSTYAQDKNVVDANGTPLPASSPAPAGLLPVPDYSADFWSRSYLTGDWGGVRTDLANKGIQIGIEWNQFVQGVSSGGVDHTTEYGATWDYTVNIDLMRMGVVPGALIRFRAESRYGDSVNLAAGPILPINTRFDFPLTFPTSFMTDTSLRNWGAARSEEVLRSRRASPTTFIVSIGRRVRSSKPFFELI
jgi:hypothetical protein